MNPARRPILNVLLPAVPSAALLMVATAAQATNGMNMEGYGPISTGMGGASQALYHGTAAMAQNPATLGLIDRGSQIDVAIGRLGPTVTSSLAGVGTARSGGTSYVMPAVGFIRRTDRLTYGAGVFAQGGMGTEYGADTFLAAGSGAPVRSELGVGRFMIPVAFEVAPGLTIGATLDYVWAGLDLRMAAGGAQFGSMVTGATGNLGAALPSLGGAPWARIDFSNSSDFSGAASSRGWAGKLGVVYEASPILTLGASYQTRSSLKDMRTSATGASISAAGGFTDSGRITVVDFQWPSMTSIGAAWRATPHLTVAADIKRIGWASVMKDFRMRYDSAGMGGSVDFALPQNWKNQTVVNLGMAYAVDASLTLRGGFNHGSNPIPAAYVNPLFPATTGNHFTVGVGYRFTPASDFNASFTIAPNSSVTNAQGVVVDHKQRNLQLMYSYRF